MNLLPILSVGFLGYIYYKMSRDIAAVVSLRRGASMSTLERRRRYQGGRKARRAGRILTSAIAFLKGIGRRPQGWCRGGYPPSLIKQPSPLVLYAYECEFSIPSWWPC